MRWQHFCCARPPLKLCRTHFDPARGGMFKQIGLIALQCAAFWGFIFDLLRPFAVKPHALDTCGQYPCMGWKVAPLLRDYCHQKIGLWNFYWWIDIHGISRSKLSHVLSYIYIYISTWLVPRNSIHVCCPTQVQLQARRRTMFCKMLLKMSALVSLDCRKPHSSMQIFHPWCF